MGTALAIFVGLYAGFWIERIGNEEDISSLIVRGALFIVPLVAIGGVFSPRCLFIVASYGVGFYYGYTIFDGAADGVARFIDVLTRVGQIPANVLSGAPIESAPPLSRTTRPELFWFYDIGILFVSLAAIGAHNGRRTTTQSEQPGAGQPVTSPKVDNPQIFQPQTPPSTDGPR